MSRCRRPWRSPEDAGRPAPADPACGGGARSAAVGPPSSQSSRSRVRVSSSPCCSWSGWCAVRRCRPASRAPAAASVGVSRRRVIASIAAWTSVRSASEIGAEPASSAAAAWPSSLTDVARKALTRSAGRLVVVLEAGDQVGDQHQRVGAGLGRLAVDLDDEVAVGASSARGEASTTRPRPPGRVRRTPRRPRSLATPRSPAGWRRRSRWRPRRAGTASMTPEVPWADSPPGDGPVAVGLVRPDASGDGGQVLGEVLRGARLVGAVHWRDRRVAGASASGLSRGDRRVVPGGDLAGEDPRDASSGERLSSSTPSRLKTTAIGQM